MKVFKSVLTFILALILTVLICLFYITNLLSNTALSKKYVLSKLDETDYYNQIYVCVESNFENYINQSGFDEDVVKNLITVDIIKSDTEKIINNIYDNAQEPLNSDIIEQNIKNNIEVYLNNNNLTASQTNIDVFVKTISDEYLNSISHSEYEQKFYNEISKLEKNLSKARKMIIIAMAISVILLLIVNIKEIFNFFTKIGASCFASGALLTFINIFINNKIDIKNLSVLNDAISNTLKGIAFDILTKISRTGFLFMVLGLIIIIIFNCAKNLIKRDVEE